MKRRNNRHAATELGIAVLGSVVGAVLARAAGIGPWGTLAGAAVLPVVSAACWLRRPWLTGRVRAEAIMLLAVVALTVTWSGVSLADYVAGRSVLPGPTRSKTFPGPTTQPEQRSLRPTPPPDQLRPGR